MKIFFSICFMFILIGSTNAQSTAPDSSYVAVFLNHSGTIMGMILSNNDKELTIKTENGDIIAVPKIAIKKIEYRLNTGGQFKYQKKDTINSNKYFFGQSAFCIPKYSYQYSIMNGICHQVNVSVLNNLTLGIGITILPKFFPVAVDAKYSFKLSDKSMLAIQGKYVSSTGDVTINYYRGSQTNLLYTYGSNINNITVCAGLLRYNNRFERFKTVYDISSNTHTTTKSTITDKMNGLNLAIGASKEINSYASLTFEVWAVPKFWNSKSTFYGGIGGVKICTTVGVFEFGTLVTNFLEDGKYVYARTLPFIGYSKLMN